MRDFRFIREFEIEWKNNEHRSREISQGQDHEPMEEEGGEFDLEDTLNQMLEERGLGPEDYW